MKNECLIVSGGVENKIGFMYPNGFDNVFVIACDKGYEYVLHQNIPCDYILGDFDSFSGTIPDGAEKLPVQKDDTDTMYAVKKAVEKGFQKIYLTCACGGRHDHSISNIQSLVYAKNHIPETSEVALFDENNEVYILKNETAVLKKRVGYSLSVLSFSEKSEGVTIKGAEYEVSDFTLTNDFPLGQSNAWREDEVKITVKNGTLLVILSKVEL